MQWNQWNVMKRNEKMESNGTKWNQMEWNVLKRKEMTCVVVLYDDYDAMLCYLITVLFLFVLMFTC